MDKNPMQSVREAEEKAEQIVKNATEEAKKMLEEAKAASLEAEKKKKLETEHEVEKIIQNAKKEADILAEPILQKGKILRDKILSLEKENLKKGVEKVKERIVN